MREYQMCNKCILDTNDDPNISFDQNGICNHCKSYDHNIKKFYSPDTLKFNTLIDKIKWECKNKKYDVLIGLSGGVDSTFVAYLCYKNKLKALAVHLDNGWNSEVSALNIKNILKNTGYDLYTYVINWSEFKDLQKSYFKANVIDIEALTDHAIFSIMQRIAIKENIKYIFTGCSVTTEGSLPEHWVHMKSDHLNIKSIQKKFGTKKIKTFPIQNYFFSLLKKKIYRLNSIDILNLYPYDKKIAKSIITKEFKWKDYGGKHYESVFTRFYQAYILPEKFKIDKRKSHYSTLICANQLKREEALKLINKPTYESKHLMKSDYEFVLKKLSFSNSEFEKYILEPEISHLQYSSVKKYLNLLVNLKRKIIGLRAKLDLLF